MTHAEEREIEKATLEKAFAEIAPALTENKVGFIVILAPLTEGIVHRPIAWTSNFGCREAIKFALADAAIAVGSTNRPVINIKGGIH
jgi:hypothetical protein